MARGVFIMLLTVCIAFAVRAQVSELESIQHALKGEITAEQRVDMLNKLSHVYTQTSLNMAETVANEAIEKATAINYPNGIAAGYNNLGISKSIRGQYTLGMEYFLKALTIREQQDDIRGQASSLGNISRLFTYQKNYDKALEYAKKSVQMFRKTDDFVSLGKTYVASGKIYLDVHDNDHAMIMFELALKLFIEHQAKDLQGWSLLQIANVHEADGEYDKALDYAFQAVKLIDLKTNLFSAIELYQSIGSIYSRKKNYEKAHKYLHQAKILSDKENDHHGSLSSRLRLSEMFQEGKQYDSALFYHQAYSALYEQTFNAEKVAQLAVIETLYQNEKKDKLLELRNQRIEFQTTIIIAGSILLAVMSVLGFILYRFYKNKKLLTIQLSRLNREISEKHEEILVQSEELTQANQEINRMNESLEGEVKLRTEKIEVQNKKLIEYAYANAHRVRGPLARIMGLVKLMQSETSPEEIKQYNHHLHASAVELDEVIRDINNELHRE